MTGRILDASPGVAGHQNYFTFLAAMAIAGRRKIAVTKSCLGIGVSEHASWPASFRLGNVVLLEQIVDHMPAVEDPLAMLAYGVH